MITLHPEAIHRQIMGGIIIFKSPIIGPDYAALDMYYVWYLMHYISGGGRRRGGGGCVTRSSPGFNLYLRPYLQFRGGGGGGWRWYEHFWTPQRSTE